MTIKAKTSAVVTARIDLGELARRESEQTEWKENVADINDVVATLRQAPAGNESCSPEAKIGLKTAS